MHDLYLLAESIYILLVKMTGPFNTVSLCISVKIYDSNQRKLYQDGHLKFFFTDTYFMHKSGRYPF